MHTAWGDWRKSLGWGGQTTSRPSPTMAIWRPAVAPTVAVVLLHVAMMAVYMTRHGGTPDAFVCVGEHFRPATPYRHVGVAFGEWGYDGQYYYALAQNPWRTHHEGLDWPPARHLRVGYPAICWLLSGGNPQALFWVMPLVNLLAIAGLAVCGVIWAVRAGISPWWGFWLPCMLNAGMPLLRDLTDVVSILGVCVLLLLWQMRGPVSWIIIAALVAMFCREQNIAIIGLVMIGAVAQRRFPLVAGLAFVVALWIGWVLLLRYSYGHWPFLPGNGNLAAPFTGLEHRLSLPFRKSFVFFTAMLYLQVALGAILFLFAKKGLSAFVLLGGLGLAAIAGPLITVDHWAFVRVLIWLPLGIWLVAVQQNKRCFLYAMIPVAFGSVVVAR